MKKTTLTTLKSFIKKNLNNLMVLEKSSFDGMVDCVMPTGLSVNVNPDNVNFDKKTNFGLPLIFICGSGRDSVEPTENGYNLYNCCGEWYIIKA